MENSRAKKRRSLQDLKRQHATRNDCKMIELVSHMSSSELGEIVSVSNLTKVYKGNVKAVDGVSLSIKKEEVFGLLGPIAARAYGVDAIRGLMLGMYKFGLLIDFLVLIVFALAIVGLGSWAFKRMKL